MQKAATRQLSNTCSKLIVADNGCCLELPGTERPVFESNTGLLLLPVFAESVGVGTPHPIDFQPLSAGGSLCLRAPLTGDLNGWVENEIIAMDDRIVCAARYIADVDHHITHWQVLGAHSRLGLPSVHANVGQGLQNLGGAMFDRDNLELSTASHNFQHWNAVPRLLLTDGEQTVAVGGTTLANDYGLELKTGVDGEVAYLRFNYGGADAPHPAPAQQEQIGPRLQIQCSTGLAPLAAYARFTAAMIADGIIPEHRYRPEHLPWQRPWYCTWADQVLLANSLTGDADWQGQRASNAVLTQDLVMRAVTRIREWDLNIGTIVIDAGWQDKRGDWNLRTDKFPDVRGMVEQLHNWGYKVHMWWAPLQVETGADVLQRQGFTYPLPGGNEHALDYTNPAVRDYIAAKVNRFFSSGPDGWDLDGLKLDWLCERIQPQADVIDPDWRGEENQLVRMQRFFCKIAARHKTVFAISSQPRNPQMANLSFTTGIPENFSDDLSVLNKSVDALKAWMPGWWIKAHCVYQPAAIAEHVRQTRALGAIPEVGLVLPKHLSDAQMNELKQALK